MEHLGLCHSSHLHLVRWVGPNAANLELCQRAEHVGQVLHSGSGTGTGRKGLEAARQGRPRGELGLLVKRAPVRDVASAIAEVRRTTQSAPRGTAESKLPPNIDVDAKQEVPSICSGALDQGRERAS